MMATALKMKLVATGGFAVGSDSDDARIPCGGDCTMLNSM